MKKILREIKRHTMEYFFLRGITSAMRSLYRE